MHKKLALFLVLMFTFFGVTLVLFKGYAKLENNALDNSYTFFSYDIAKVENLATLSSSCIITEEQLQQEDKFVADFLVQKEAPFLDRLRVYTYLYAAQREFAFLTYSTKHHFEGDLHFLTDKILNLFYPDYTPKVHAEDVYSQKLVSIIFAPLQKRFEEEENLKKAFPTGQWIPWMAKPSSQFYPPPYNKNQLASEIQEVIRIQKNASPLQKQETLYWVGGFGSDSGDWIAIGNLHLFDEKHNLPLGKIILIRNLLSITLYDAEIASYEAKYHYGVRRPFAINNAISPIGSAPESPSYPSSHAALASGAATLLTHFLPSEKALFAKIRDEACHSRLVAGVHTRLDLVEGKKMGEKIANEVLIKEWDVKEQESASQQHETKEQFVHLVGGKYNSRPKCCSRKALWQRSP